MYNYLYKSPTKNKMHLKSKYFYKYLDNKCLTDRFKEKGIEKYIPLEGKKYKYIMANIFADINTYIIRTLPECIDNKCLNCNNKITINWLDQYKKYGGNIKDYKDAFCREKCRKQYNNNCIVCYKELCPFSLPIKIYGHPMATTMSVLEKCCSVDCFNQDMYGPRDYCDSDFF